MGISQVNQIVKEQPSRFVTLYGMTSTLRELWRNQKLPSIPLNCKEQETFTTAF